MLRLPAGDPEQMKPALCLILVALPLAAQPKLLVNAQVDSKSAAAGLDAAFKGAVAAQPQPSWIAYSVPSIRVFMGCDYVRDGWNQPGVIHLHPPHPPPTRFRPD